MRWQSFSNCSELSEFCAGCWWHQWTRFERGWSLGHNHLTAISVQRITSPEWVWSSLRGHLGRLPRGGTICTEVHGIRALNTVFKDWPSHRSGEIKVIAWSDDKEINVLQDLGFNIDKHFPFTRRNGNSESYILIASDWWSWAQKSLDLTSQP